MPRASKAVDAARQLGRKVAAAGAAKSKTKAATKTAKTTAKTAKTATAPKSASKVAVGKVAKDSKVTKDTKRPKADKAAPAPKRAAGSKTATVAKKLEKAVEKRVEEKEAKAAKPARKADTAGVDKFLEEQRALLDEERISYLAQAADLKAEADQLAQEMEPGDIQFDDESGEGATAAVDRERDLALSAQARVEVDEIDHALAKLEGGSYGICEGCGQPIPRPRLRALPHARLCVACKSGGLSRR